jgi:hypothetical protein
MAAVALTGSVSKSPNAEMHWGFPRSETQKNTAVHEVG